MNTNIISNCGDHPVLAKQSRYESSYVWLSKSRSIFLKQNVSKELASELVALLIYFDSQSDEEITLYLHSNGGDADGLVNIYDIMQLINAPVRTVCIGKAYSAAAVLLAAGAPGQRYAMKNSKIMLHGLQFAFPILGQDQVDSKNYLSFLKKNDDNIMKIVSYHTKQPLNKVKLDCSRDLFLNASEALKYGIIDHIL